MVSIERAAAVASYVNVAIGGGVWLNGVGLTNALDLASRAMQPSVSLPTCPSAEELQALASGDLPPDVAARIEQHVAGCSRCSGVMETVSLAGSAGIAATSLATACTQPGGVAATIDYHGAQELPPEGASAKSNNNLLGGRYRLGEFIARGGMGTVHRATDELFQRQVAVKLLLGVEGRDSSAIKSAADRFRYEAAVTARLQHPGIPPVHDLSLLADGSPFLAMKLIEGRTLAELLAERKFPQDELTRWLHIFEQIAQTVGYAHAQGVIHRDLKPHNVMVGAFGEVQVMDWGLAKELGKTEPSLVGDIRPTDAAAPDDPTERTQAGAILGTPAYMAPEQARGETDRLDSRADVFALGAMLCQILTGGLPYSGKRSAELIAQASAGRLEYGQAQLQASGADPDIVSLAIHCLAPLAADRPATGAEVAAAVAQHRATVESRLRQAETDRAVGQQRLIEQHKRRRVWIGLAAVLLFGVLASTLLAIRAEYQRGKAVTATADAIQARLRETAEKEAAQTARDLARSRYMLALDAFDEMVFGIQEKLNTRPGTLALRQDLLSNARNGLQKLMQEAEKQGAPDHTLVWSHLRMGDVELALGNTNGAHQEFLAGHLLAQKLAAVDPRNAQAQRDLSVSFEKLGNVAMQLGQTDEALRNYQQSLEITQRIATVDSRDAQAQHDLSVSFDNLGNVNLQLGQTDEAVRNYQQSLEIRQRLAATDPRNAQTERDLSVSFDNLGNVTLQLGQTDEALRNYQRSLEIRQRLAIADGQNAQAQRALSTSFESLGDVTLRRGQTDEALRNYQQSLEIRQRLAAADPQDAQAQRDLSLSFNKVGNVILQLGQTDKALRTYQQGLEIRQRLAAADPRNAQVQRELSISLNSLGNMTLQLGQTDEALRNYQQSLKIFQRLAAADPRDAQAQRELSISVDTMGNVTLQLGR
ncbi:MAG: tetratricopeptide repeat protein, partial [Pirellulales bacterium]